jgi:DNA-binding NarL/FixJ family response regulator
MTEQMDNVRDKKQLIDHLNRQISELKNQVKSASLEMEMMRARMNDLSRDAKQSVQIERFSIPDPDRLREINEIVDLMDKAIKKNRRSRKAKAEKTGPAESTSLRKLDERMILIVLKLRRKGCYIQEIASHVGLAHGTIHNIIRRYGSDPQMQSLITEGTQLEISDYLLIRTDETDREK